jgi:RNA polymerase sigma factor (sigma-70 family)
MTPSITAVTGSLAPTRGPGGEITDVELVAAVRQGDDRAFERLYERYHRRIAAYIYGMVNDYGRAEDIAQDVFMSALRRMRETDRPIAFKPWVYEIAKNACIDQFRRSRRSEEISYDAEDGLGTADYGRLVTTGPSPDVAVDQKAALNHLCGAFGGLSETHHRILVMRELEGLSYREIGEQLGMSRPSVESTLFRARRRLTEEYAELTSGARCLRVQATLADAAAAAGGAGLRDHRRLSAHLSHCQPCRRAAHAAGLDVAALPGRAVRAKIAAFLPLPAFLRRRGGGSGDLGSSHAGTVAHWSAQMGTIDPGAAGGWFKAATAAAMLAVVGVGAGEGTEQLTQHGERPVVAAVAPARTTKAPARSTVAAPARRAAAVAAGTVRQAPVAGTTRKRTTGFSGTPRKTTTATGTSTQAAGPKTTAERQTTLPASTTPAVVPTPQSLLPLGGGTTANAPRPTPGKPVVDPKVQVPIAIPPLPADPVTPVLDDATGAVTGAVGAVAGIVAGQ